MKRILVKNTRMSETSAKSKKINPLIIIAIVAVVFLVVAGLVINFIVKKASTKLIEGVIENKTGVKTDIKDLEKGNVTFTDTKTGQTVNVGGNTLPDTFPKDFPIYKGAKVVSSISGTQTGQANGFLVTFTTSDGLNKVVPFYKSELNSNGWEITSSFDSDSVQTWTVSKNNIEGSVSITGQEKETAIQVMLGNKE